ncbi:MAG: phage capsid protein [Candidatus Cloacimonetes bacterium]|nr:phage capsid protein [Candidatus Cloacimonadota bacterium]
MPNTVDNFYPKLFGDRTHDSMIKALQETQYVLNSITDYTPFTNGKKADGYHGPKLGLLEAQKLPIADKDFARIEKSSIHIPFDKEFGVSFVISDIEESMSNVNIQKECATKAKDALLELYDDEIIKEMISKSENKIKLSTGTKLQKSDFMKARKILNAKKAPRRGRYAALCVEHESQLYDIEGFISRDKIKDTNAVKEGVIGRLMGFDIILVQDMPKIAENGLISDTEAQNTKEVSVFYSTLSIGFARQKEFGVKTSPDAGLPGDKMNIYSVFGLTAQEPNFVVTMRDN